MRQLEMETYNGDKIELVVDDDGWIRLQQYGHFGDRRFCQRDVIDLATLLVESYRLSTDRNQIGRPSYYDTVNIERRANSPVGKALAALRKVL